MLVQRPLCPKQKMRQAKASQLMKSEVQITSWDCRGLIVIGKQQQRNLCKVDFFDGEDSEERKIRFASTWRSTLQCLYFFVPDLLRGRLASQSYRTARLYYIVKRNSLSPIHVYTNSSRYILFGNGDDTSAIDIYSRFPRCANCFVHLMSFHSISIWIGDHTTFQVMLA